MPDCLEHALRVFIAMSDKANAIDGPSSKFNRHGSDAVRVSNDMPLRARQRHACECSSGALRSRQRLVTCAG